jgi:hypothetical protein
MRPVLVCSACGSAVAFSRSSHGEPKTAETQTQTPSHCSNLNCPNNRTRTMLARSWYRRTSRDRERPN